MSTSDAYNNWAETYDVDVNKTRDLEAIALRSVLEGKSFHSVLEAGCGTGKNTSFLKQISKNLISVDFSEEMMNVAKAKYGDSVTFIHADLTEKWIEGKFDLIVCSLVLEHISDLNHIFHEASQALNDTGTMYICELHPYRQLNGGRAKFERNGNVVELEYFIHHISDFITGALNNRFQCISTQEWFDDNDRSTTPRLCSFLMVMDRKK